MDTSSKDCRYLSQTLWKIVDSKAVQLFQILRFSSNCNDINSKSPRMLLGYMLAKRVQPIEITNDIGFPGWPELNLD
jgi:hypothetical protein